MPNESLCLKKQVGDLFSINLVFTSLDHMEDVGLVALEHFAENES